MKKPDRACLHFTVFAASVWTILQSIPITWTSPAIPILLSNGTENPLPNQLTTTESSWIMSLLSLGAAIGPIITAFTTKIIGPKITMLVIAVGHIISFCMLAFAEEVWLFFIARIISGISVGCSYAVVTPYVADISPDNIRGATTTFLGVTCVFGMFLPNCIGPFVSIMTFNLICAAISVVSVIFYFLIPESPVHLITKQKEAAAKKVLIKLRGTEDVAKELEIMLRTRQNNSGKIVDLFKIKTNLKALLITVTLIILQQLSGINVVLANSQSIFEATGSHLRSDISSIIIGCMQVLTSFIAPLLVDRVGRKILLMLSASAMAFSQLCLSTYFFLQENDHDVEDIFWLPIFSLVIYIVGFNLGFGAIPWTIAAELFPPNVISFACSIAASVSWIVSFFLVHFYNELNEFLGVGTSFLIYCCFNILALIFVVFGVPETNGKTTIEIQEMLK